MDQPASPLNKIAFGDVQRIPYEAAFSETEFARLKAGLVPTSMEQKWAMHFSGMTLFFYRSWTAQPVYRVELEHDGPGVKVATALCASDVLSKGDADFFTQLLNFIIRSLVLGGDASVPVPEGFEEDTSGFVQHVLVGSPYLPSSAQAVRPWWKFWLSRKRDQKSVRLRIAAASVPSSK